MAKKITIFNKLIKAISKKEFDELAIAHRANHYVKQFDAWSHLLAMVYAQLTPQDGLRALEMNFNYVTDHEKIKNVSKIRRATLSDANKRRPVDFFIALYQSLIKKLIRPQRKELKEVIRLLDSTPIQLNGRGHQWAEATQRIRGLKAHFVYDPTSSLPVYFSITSSRVNDIVEGQRITPMPGVIFVYDRAYYDFSWWSSMTEAGATFVTRTKSTFAYKVISRKNTADDDQIILDATVQLTSKKRHKHKKPLRLVQAWVEIQGMRRKIELITNNIKLPSSRIVSLYKQRWEIELFFKWVKQNLKIKKFFGENENAIKIQIVVAMIAYILMKILALQSRERFSMRELALFLKSHLFGKVKEYACRNGQLEPSWALIKPRRRFFATFPGH